MNELLAGYLHEVEKITGANLSLRNKYLQLKQILERSCKELTISESLQFSSLFSRLVFLAQKYQLPKSLEWKLQGIRVKSNFLLLNENNLVGELDYVRAKKALSSFFSFLSGSEQLVESESDETSPPKAIDAFDKLRVQLIAINREERYLLCQSDSIEEAEIKVCYDVEKVNREFNETIDRLWINAQLNLIDVRVNKEGYYIAKGFILEPDYLIDASAIAECFQDFAKSHLQYFRRKLEPPVSSHYILLGNLANFFLDEIIFADNIEDLKFEDIFRKSFAQMPFEYSSCKDIAEPHAFVEFMQKASKHFRNIKRVVMYDMAQNGFDRHKCILEPSFFCEKYGFQGRLDLLQLDDEKNEQYNIIELKSGKAPFPSDNPTKIALNHEVQTLVYRLMIQSVFEKDTRFIYPTILYSSVDNKSQNLRWAAHYQQLEKEIMNTRNLIVATEHDLYAGDANTVAGVIENLLDINSYVGSKPAFFGEKLAEIQKVLNDTSSIEKLYFYRYINFISRELYLQKVGDEAMDTTMSQAALWNTKFMERKEALELISELEIEQVEDTDYDMSIRFARVDREASSNFREGEICVLYPRDNESDSILSNQILKGTVVELSATHLVLRFRYKQRNKSLFDKYKRWVVEHDLLDHSYNSMYKSLFALLTASPSKKDLLLGLRSPVSYTRNDSIALDLSCEEKQEVVIEKALQAEDYFLIVGPPGTGKTSVFARRLIEKLYEDESTNILVLAYTNRAVDELCEAICNAFEEKAEDCRRYVRIGASLSCGESYRHRLLQNISHGVKSRKELVDTLSSTRIFIATLASIVGKPELFSLKKFHTAIIDEASQILEPQIIGLLPNFERFIMIGDHKQLSTITLQNTGHSVVSNSELNDIGLYDCRESLFERLFHTCQKNGWTHAYDTLVYHGRMHRDIAGFVNEYFYGGVLREIEQRQQDKLSFDSYNSDNPWERILANERFAFLSVCKSKNISNKINQEEANIVVSLSVHLFNLYKRNNKPFEKQTLGIITPYRNQIALIKAKLSETQIPELSEIMVDTVERFQGSQRDVIIVSFCMSQPYQLKYFSNMNKAQTVDRKLNVTLTRAREQLFLIGDKKILQQNSIYDNLLKQIALVDVERFDEL